MKPLTQVLEPESTPNLSVPSLRIPVTLLEVGFN